MTTTISGTTGVSKVQDGVVVQADLALGTNGAFPLPGTNTNDNASVGKIGEYVESTALYSAYISNVVVNSNAYLTLQPGDWDVSGFTRINGTSATITFAACGIATAPASLGADYSALQMGGAASLGADYSALQMGGVASSVLVLVAPTVRISIAEPTAVYVGIQLFFGTGTLGVSSAKIRARRVR